MDEDRVIKMLLDHEGRLERIEHNMVTKKDHDEVMQALDVLIKRSETKDQEVTLHSYRMRELTDTVEEHSHEIKKIKEKVGMR
ncbi:MAG: hypothetical protein A3C90_00880 [Candidatus Magasanikbacteria bacterium RIFCSPHIGHO2_02_FULL_51_14]|uniref:Uncharacterized protein n=1 Tax=Candidatus Magasanikbacteria bacterium RIFCSPHIGHO2_02_FULL_51_14 TaxID=1798683 RepID=A0A1F6MQR7_9BACT|nr:MAG: hypothetical protein A3C90_00880 [Candidatus Magasanikbacteria bacterium RIFCSPHIGHO2_02_FULL_51_14]